MNLSKQVVVIGVGVTKFGDNFDKSYQDMIVSAVYSAYEDAQIERDEIDACFVGTAEPQAAGGEGEAPSAGDYLGLINKPVTRVTNFCTTGMEAVRCAALAVASGMYKIVLAVGCEKMRDVSSRGSLIARHIFQTHPLICKGRTPPGQFALRATRYLHQYKYTEETLAKVAVKNHYNGSLNPKAHFQRKITEEEALKTPYVAEPLRLSDCCPTTDGAAAAILTTKEEAERRGSDYVLIKGMGLAISGGYFNWMFDEDNNYLNFTATQEAAKQAYSQAKIKNPLDEIDVAEVHDCFTITELLNYEDLGFCKIGEGGKLIEEGITRLDGKLPVNPSGGLKSCGHPIGATGVRMVAEITDQIRGRCDKRQVKSPKTGLCHTLGGPGVVSCVIILGG